MNNSPPSEPGSQPNDSSAASVGNPAARRGFRIGRLAMKELRETLRDRRTIITLIAMPLLVYPILSLVFRTFLFSNLATLPADQQIEFVIAVETSLTNPEFDKLRETIFAMTHDQFEDLKTKSQSENAGAPTDEQPVSPLLGNSMTNGHPEIANFFKHKWAVFHPTQEEILQAKLESAVKQGDADVGLRLQADGDTLRSQLVFDPGNPRSSLAASYLSKRFDLFNLRHLLAINGREKPVVDYHRLEVQVPQKASAGVSIAAIIPLMLVLMTITGAVYPAIDLTAGERERGTLETLIAAPIPRISILFSKFVAVISVAILTAALNIVGMLVTMWAFRLDQFLAGPDGITLMMVAKIFGLLVLFAGFFSALLLAITSYARSFKEAQAYLIPVILLSLAPGLMALTPGLSIDGPLAVAPMVNILLLARDVLEGHVSTIPAIIAVVSTFLYGCLAILVAAKIFGTDAILYGSQGSWKDLVTRPSDTQPLVPLSIATSCLVLLFPANFVLIGILGRFEGELTNRLLLMGLFTFLTFWALPTLVAAFQKVDLKTGFGLIMPRPKFLLVGLLLGLSLWPLVMSIISGWQVVLEIFMGQAESQQWHDRLIEFGEAQASALRDVNPAVIALTFAILPAVCEEWFFRGFLLRSFLSKRSPWIAIGLSALVFGLFHVLSNSVVAMDRLLPTTLVGIVLGILCYRSGSIIPGILLHMLHNAVIAFLAYFQPQLSKLSWFPQAEADIPVAWIIASTVVSLVTFIFLIYTKPDDSPATVTAD